MSRSIINLIRNMKLAMNTLTSRIRLITFAFCLLTISACSTLKSTDDPTKQVSSDPFQGFNRGVYSFNYAVDKAFLKPIAQGYKAVTPDPVERGVGNFFRNLNEPLNIFNNLLQGKIDGALSSTYRFTVNSTVGVLGLFDVAKSYNVNPSPEDFGQTLASWGVSPGPYIIVPFLGPTNFRDGVGRIIDTSVLYPNQEITDSSQGETGLLVLNVINLRACLLYTSPSPRDS